MSNARRRKPLIRWLLCKTAYYDLKLYVALSLLEWKERRRLKRLDFIGTLSERDRTYFHYEETLTPEDRKYLGLE